MKFLKPKFWDKKQISFFSILLLPIALLIKLLNFLNRFFHQKLPLLYTCYLCRKYLSGRNGKNTSVY